LARTSWASISASRAAVALTDDDTEDDASLGDDDAAPLSLSAPSSRLMWLRVLQSV
jgi:hypothetical protein